MSGAVLTAPFPTETLMNHFHNEMTFGQVGNDIALLMLITAATHTTPSNWPLMVYTNHHMRHT